MRLLFDEQLAEELCEFVRDAFPDSQHVRLLGGGGASDDKVWQLALEHRCVLVTKDEDFHRPDIQWFVDQEEATFLELGRGQ